MTFRSQMHSFIPENSGKDMQDTGALVLATWIKGEKSRRDQK